MMNPSKACEMLAIIRCKHSKIAGFSKVGQRRGLRVHRRLSGIAQSSDEAQRPWPSISSGQQPMVRMVCQRHDDAVSSRQTVSSLLKDMTERFEEADIPESSIAAEYIMTHVLGKCRLSEFSRVDQSRHLSEKELNRISTLVEQKLQRMPVQYIIGEWDFRDLTLKMRPPVFIPRPETEMLVDLVTGHYEEDKLWRFLEIGCGTGAISLSLLKKFQKAQVTAIDGSAEAVELTRENAERLGLLEHLEVHHMALTEEVPEVIKSSGNYDAVISNPPYVFSSEMDDLDPEIKRYEDPGAFDAGPDGLTVIRCVIKHASRLLKPEGLIWLETDSRHHEMIQDWLCQHPEMGVHFRRSFLDFSDRPRFCQLEYAPSRNADCRC